MQGVLKGKSLRRTTPIDDISRPLPSSAVWKLVQLCCGSGKRKKEYSQGWTLTDEPLCKLCQTPCQYVHFFIFVSCKFFDQTSIVSSTFRGINAKTPEYFEDLFCNLGCYEEYRVRISSTSLRRVRISIIHVFPSMFYSSTCVCSSGVKCLLAC